MTSAQDNDQRSALERKARALFQDSVAGTDGTTSSRLTQARHRALAQLQQPEGSRPSRWLPAGAVAAAAVVLLTLVLGRLPDGGPELGTAVATDLEILLDKDELELIEELEFYAWLDEQPELEDVRSDSNGVG